MKSIVVHVQEDPGLSARLQVALDIARSCDGHVSCLQTASIEVLMPSGYEAVAVPTILPILREQAEQLEAEVKAKLERDDVPWDWQTRFGSAVPHLLRRASLADLIVMGGCDPGSTGRSPSRIVGQLVVSSPAPILVVPDDQRGFDSRLPVLVGWNGSPEAANALRAALPLLKQAKQVFLARVVGGPDDDEEGFTEIEGAQYLSRHGVECELVELPGRDGASIAQQIYDAASVRGCGLLVIGGYGHARIAEWLLGGVTRGVLSKPQLPVLLAH